MLFGRILSKKLLFNLLAFFIILVLGLWSLFPIVKNPGSRLTGGGDVLLTDYVLNQNIKKIPFGIFTVFQGKFFYPFKDSMAFSDLFLPDSLVSYIPVKITGQPPVAFNFNLIFGQIVLMAVCFLWFLEITKDTLSSLVGSVALGLSRIRMFFNGYLQIWTSYWWIGSIWMFWRFLKYGENKYLYFAAALAAIQMWEGPLPVLFIIFSSFSLAFLNSSEIRMNLKKLIGPLILFLVMAAPIILKYYSVSKRYNIIRPIREAAHFSMSLGDPFGILFSPGLYSIFLICFLLFSVKLFKNNKNLVWSSFMSLFSFVMALGPVLKVNGATFKILDKIFIPLPYGIFYYIFPGFKGLRTPFRWIWLAAFFATFTAVIVLSKYKSKYKNVILGLCLLVAVVGGTQLNYTINVPSTNDYPEEYRYIKDLPGNVIIEIPMYDWGVGTPFQNEFWREYYAIYHQKYTVNGASGMSPPAWNQLQVNLRRNFPDGATTQTLRGLGVDYVIVHKDELSASEVVLVNQWGKDKKIWENGKTEVFDLSR